MSAFAAAKLARQNAQSSSTPPARAGPGPETEDALPNATDVAAEPYDGHHSGRTTPGTASIEEEVVAPRQPKHPSVQLSTFKRDQSNVIRNDDDCFEFTLQENETATFVGEYQISVNSGIITVYGAVLRPNSSPQRVHAPSITALPEIQARQANTSISISSTNSGVRKLGKLSPLFRNIWTANSDSKRTFEFLGASEDDTLRRSLNPLEIDRDMDVVLRTLSAKCVSEREQLRIMAIGGKSSGKSTFNRILCNHLHSWTPGKKCIYLDLDPGQPEFGPPGQVSLVEVSAPITGSPFTHPASQRSPSFRLLRSHTIAATSFKDDPSHYVACAKELASRADRKYPLICNACGWTSGLGASILLDLFSDMAITDIVLLEPVDADLVQSLQQASYDVAFHRIARRPPRPSTRSPAEMRAMQTMAYFHHRLGPSGVASRFSGKPLSRTRHWNASYARPSVGITAVLSYNQSPDSEFLAETLSGSVVSLVVLEKEGHSPLVADEDIEMLGDVSELISRTPEDIPFIEPTDTGITSTLDPRHTHCLGLALIRGIDTETNCFQLITPMSEIEITELKDKQVFLVRGSFDSPDWAYLEDLHKDDQEGKASFDDTERPWVNIRSQVGIESAVWRLRHPPMANAVASKD